MKKKSFCNERRWCSGGGGGVYDEQLTVSFTRPNQNLQQEFMLLLDLNTVLLQSLDNDNLEELASV